MIRGCSKKTTIALFVGSDVSSYLLSRALVPALLESQFRPLVYFPVHRSKPSPFPELRELAFFERELAARITNPSPHAPKVENVNAPSFLEELDAEGADVGISIRCYQKFGRPLIDFFHREGESGLWNLHPGLLPMYRGVMTVFRSMLEGQDEIGYTLHVVDETWDGGPILGMRTMPLVRTDAMLTSYCELAPLGVPLILDALHRYRYGTLCAATQDAARARYHTFPTRAEMDAFLACGMRLVDPVDMRLRYNSVWGTPGTAPDAELTSAIDDAIADYRRCNW